MRTAILLGALCIADAIQAGKPRRMNKDTLMFIGLVLLIFIIMDFFDFFVRGA